MTVAALALSFAVLAQGAIALGLLWRLGTIRLPLIARKEVALEAMALSRDPWPAHEKQVANAFDNQFQLPVLFYVAALLALHLGPGPVEAGLAWLFVASRVVHAAIFVTSNHVVRRFAAFTVGFCVLGLLWIALAIRFAMLALGNA